MKVGEKLVRTLIGELDAKIKLLTDAQRAGRIGPRLARYRLRFVRAEYDRLAAIARSFGFEVPAS